MLNLPFGSTSRQANPPNFERPGTWLRSRTFPSAIRKPRSRSLKQLLWELIREGGAHSLAL